MEVNKMLITIISISIALIGTAFGIFIALRSKQASRPVLTFNIGLLNANQDVIFKLNKNGIKKAAISTLIYGANVPQNSEVFFACPYLLLNNSVLPISNVTLQLEYASKYALENKGDKVVIHGIDYEFVLDLPPMGDCKREVQMLDSMAQVRYTIPVLRPGEKIAITDCMKFINFKHCEESHNTNYVMDRELVKNLSKIKKLCDFCIVDIYVYSENCSLVSKRLKLLWFDTISTDELNSLAEDSLNAFWGGNFPKPGLYWNPWPWNKLIMEEYGEAIIPKLKTVQISKDRYFYWENPLESARNIYILKMPPWDYYQLSCDLDTDNLIMRSGFRKVIDGKQMKKLWNIFKWLRK